MTLNTFLEILKSNPSKQLRFSYSSEKFVNNDYHITEVKHILIDSVDCGAKQHQWRETVIQLLEPNPHNILLTQESMTAFKALGILNKVGKIKPYTLNSEVKFEYGNQTFHTTQLVVDDVTVNASEIIIELGRYNTACKALEACGIEPPVSQSEVSFCEPSSGCC